MELTGISTARTLFSLVSSLLCLSGHPELRTATAVERSNATPSSVTGLGQRKRHVCLTFLVMSPRLLGSFFSLESYLSELQLSF